MLVVACLLLTASWLMGLTSFYLALFAVVLTIDLAGGFGLLGAGLCAALAWMAIWSETALALVQIGVLAGVKPYAEGHVAAGAGLAIACFFCILGMPWAVLLVPSLVFFGCASAVWHRRRSPKQALLSSLALMSDKGDCRYLRGIMLMILFAFLMKRVAS